MSWRSFAKCKSVDRGIFFTEQISAKAVAPAKAICSGCAVKQQCLDYALTHNVRGSLDGVWGGTTKAERSAIRYRRLEEMAE